jgi:alcohol dehydrogenase
MLAVHLESGRVEIRKVPVPRVPKGFALIRMLAAGICSTDLELQRGYYGFRGTPGHEFVGDVVEAHDRSWIGQRVAGEINLACGHCDWCARGLGRHCPNRTVLGIVKHPGAFAEFLTLPIANLHPLPKSISIRKAVFIEPLAAACEILDQIHIPEGERVAILGDGKLGLLIAQVLAARGDLPHVFGRHRANLRMLQQEGISAELVKRKLPERAYRFVVDATGSAQGLPAAISMCEPRGVVIMKSTVHGTVAMDTAPAIVNEIMLLGSRCGRFEPAIKLLTSRKVHVTDLIAAEFPLNRAPEAFALAAKKGVLKVLLRAPR